MGKDNIELGEKIENIFNQITPELRQDISQDNNLINILNLCCYHPKNIELFETIENEALNQDGSIAYGQIFHLMDRYDPETAQHCFRVSRYTRWIAEKLDLDGSTTQALVDAALIHDIGKIILPEKLRNGGEYKEGSEEKELIRYGHAILSEVVARYIKTLVKDEDKNMDPLTFEGITKHHDTSCSYSYIDPDGKNQSITVPAYPHKEEYGMKDEKVQAISISDQYDSSLAQIIMMIDKFDAGTGRRTYQQNENIKDMTEKVKKMTQFNDRYRNALAEIIEERPQEILELYKPKLNPIHNL